MTFYYHYNNITYIRIFKLHYTQNETRKELFYEQKAKGHYDYPHCSYAVWRIGSTFLSAGHNTTALWSKGSKQRCKQILFTAFRSCSGYPVLGNLP